MAGRKRRYSDVSGDESTKVVQCLAEQTALRPVALDIDPVEWPCFLLEDATVYTHDGKAVANLLNVDLRGPFRVRGKLHVEENLQDCFTDLKHEGCYIEVGVTRHFSIGYNPTVVWASGAAGWFEIKPSTLYTPVYKKIIEAIDMYFSITIIYETLKAIDRKSLKSDQVLMQYALNEGTGLIRSEVVDRCQEHAEFLISQMWNNETIKWRATAFFKWLIAQAPGEYQRLQDMKAQPTEPDPRPPAPGCVHVNKVTPSQSAKPKSLANAQAAAKQSQDSIAMRADPSRSIEKTNGSLPISNAASTIGKILQTLNMNHAKRHKMSSKSLGNILYYDYSIGSYSLAKEIVKAYAKPIFAALNDDWVDTPLFTQLENLIAAKAPRSETYDEAFNFELHPRSRKPRFNSQPKSYAYTAIDESISTIEGSNSPNTPGSVGKTVPHPYTGRPSGKSAGLRLISSPLKRSSSSIGDSSSDDETVRRKRIRKNSLVIETGSPESQSHAHSGPHDVDDMEFDDEGIFELVSDLVPSIEATGPNGMWTCQNEGCYYVVRAAAEEGRQQQIREHILEHADVMARKSLILREARPHLPVSHLLEKLHASGEKAQANKEMNVLRLTGLVVPQPIKRRGMVL